VSNAPWSNNINLSPEGGILENARQLAQSIGLLGDMFGASKCHLIAHSKGGLDTRAFLNNDYDASWVRVLSLYTLSTPHHGTILADIVASERAAAKPESSNADLEELIKVDSSVWLTLGPFLSSFPQGDALRDQTTDAMARFNTSYPTIPNNILFYSYGADADLDHNGTIEQNESAPNLGLALSALFYRVIGTTGAIRVTRGTRPGRLWGENTYTSIDVAATNSPFVLNDLVVSEVSAHAPTGTYIATRSANHSSIKSTDVAAEIFNRILKDFPSQ
jgi:hypothetical protein